MSELAVSLLRLSYLALLWLFVLAALGVLRRDTYGTRIVRRGAGPGGQRRGRRGRLAAPTPVGASSVSHPSPPRVAAPAIPATPSTSPVPLTPPAPPPPPAEPSSARRLVVTSGPLKGTSLPLGSGLTIGRSGTSNLVLDDEFTSGRHAQIVPRDGQWYVEDLGSTNGTFVGRRRVEGPERIEVGTPLRVGQTRMELR